MNSPYCISSGKVSDTVTKRTMAYGAQVSVSVT